MAGLLGSVRFGHSRRGQGLSRSTESFSSTEPGYEGAGVISAVPTRLEVRNESCDHLNGTGKCVRSRSPPRCPSNGPTGWPTGCAAFCPTRQGPGPRGIGGPVKLAGGASHACHGNTLPQGCDGLTSGPARAFDDVLPGKSNHGWRDLHHSASCKKWPDNCRWPSLGASWRRRGSPFPWVDAGTRLTSVPSVLLNYFQHPTTIEITRLHQWNFDAVTVGSDGSPEAQIHSCKVLIKEPSKEEA